MCGMIQSFQNLYLCVLFVAAMLSFMIDLKNIIKNGWNQKIWEIHNRSSIFMYRIENSSYPSTIEILADISYVIKIILKKSTAEIFYFFIFLIVLLVIFKITWFVPILSFIVNWLCVLILIIIIIYFYNSSQTIEIRGDYKNLKNLKISEVIRFILLIPYRWAFIFIYHIKDKKKIPHIELSYLLSINFLKIPLWYLYEIVWWSLKITDILFAISDLYQRKSFKGVLRSIISEISELILNRVFKLNFKLNSLMYDRKIIVSYKKINLNGKISIFFEKSNLLKDPKFLNPVKILVGGDVHQGWRLSTESNQVFIMTSSKLVITFDGLYSSIRMNYETEKENQFLTYSYISNDLLKNGTMFNTMGSNQIFEYGKFCGFILKFNILYEFYSTKQILIQDSDNKYLQEISTPLPIKLGYSEENSLNIDEIRTNAENILISYNSDEIKSLDSNLNRVLSSSYDSLFNLARKHENWGDFEVKIKELIENGKIEFTSENI